MRNKISIALLLLVLSSTALTSCSLAAKLIQLGESVELAQGGPGNDAELDEIAGIYLNGNPDRALQELDGYLDRYPSDDLAWTIKGNILEDKDLDADAELAYREALSLNPENFQATNALGVIYRKQGNYDTAMEYYQRALELEPDYAQAYSSMAVIELKRENDAKALELAIKGYDNDPEDPIIASNLAVAYHYNGLFEKRDEFAAIARDLGYPNMSSLYQIFNGELTIRDQ